MRYSTFGFCILALFPFLNLGCSSLKRDLRATQGLLNLAQEDGDKLLSLGGEWLALPGFHADARTMLEARDKNELLPYTIGQELHTLEMKSKQGAPGIATLALWIHGLPQGKILAMGEPSLFTAGRIYWQNASEERVLFELGKSGADKEHSIPAPFRKDFRLFPNTESSALILIHISNFHHTWGGVWVPPQIGPPELFINEIRTNDSTSFIIIGAFIFIAFYNASLFLRRREDQGALWLAVLAAVLALREVMQQGFLDGFLPQTALFDISLKMNYLAAIVPLPVGFLFFHSYFPAICKAIYVKIAVAIGVPCILLILFFSPNTYGYLGYPATLLSNLGGVFLIGVVAYAVYKKQSGALVSLLGLGCMMIGALLELSTTFDWIRFPGSPASYGLLGFILFQGQIVAVRFVEAFRNSERLSRDLRLEVDRQTRDIKCILDSIHQGVFTLEGSPARVGPQYSPYLKNILHRETIEGSSLEDLIFSASLLNSDQKNQIHETIGVCIGQDELNFEANMGAFPSELQLLMQDGSPHRIVELEWSVITNGSRQIEKILVCLRDVTEIRGLKKIFESHERSLNLVLEIINVQQQRFSRFIKQVHRELDEIKGIIQQAKPEQRIKTLRKIFVCYHTLKGVARTLKLTLLAMAFHQAENLLSTIRKDPQQWSEALLLRDLEEIYHCMHEYSDQAIQKLNWDVETETVTLEKGAVQTVLPWFKHISRSISVADHVNKLRVIEMTILRSVSSSLQQIVSDACRSLSSIARQLDKEPPEVKVLGLEALILDKWVDAVFGALVHVTRNALDHGLEKPDERMREGKKPQGTIVLECSEQDGFLNIDVRDDGRGLNLTKIAHIGRASGLLSDHENDPQKIANLILSSGFSTKDQVSDISGRGVGLDAAKTTLKEAGGDLFILLDKTADHSRSFKIRIALPALCWMPIIHDGLEPSWDKSA